MWFDFAKKLTHFKNEICQLFGGLVFADARLILLAGLLEQQLNDKISLQHYARICQETKGNALNTIF